MEIAGGGRCNEGPPHARGRPMIAAPIPVDDAERLAALGSLKVLDTEPEERYDRITRVLSLIMQVPIAYVSLVSPLVWLEVVGSLPTW